ncbi:MAG: cardiolipin synthase [Erysipelotrichaceae bacterium]
MRKIISFFMSKMFLVGILILLQLLLVMGVILWLSDYFLWVYAGLNLLSLSIVVYLLNKNENPAYKLAWTIPILIFPLFGGIFYLVFGNAKMPKELLSENLSVSPELQLAKEKGIPIVDLQDTDLSAHKQATYINRNAGFPLYRHTETRFLPTGEIKFEVMLEELEKAEKYIFMEYFIIMEGKMWNTILEVLVRKVKAGVDVRLIYDDAGCLQTLPNHYDRYLRSLGIKVKVFNRIRPTLAIRMNNRDHRKIMVVDGKVGITGGINLSDEYINAVTLHGHWKDSSVLLKGAAVFSLTAMFIQFWNFHEKEKEDVWNYYLGEEALKQYQDDGVVQPYADSPTDKEYIGEYSHINMINEAKRYVYIQTPYLIIDNEMRTALSLAAKSGVDVRILVPHYPDKAIVFEMTKSNYKALLASGVKIYEYTPGFVHAKTLVADDEVAIIGTINMDYRSYYLHFECGSWFYKSKCVMELKEDYLKTLQVSQEIHYNEVVNIPWYRKVLRAMLNLFAPMA